jgi:hypothetical protein
MNSKHNLVSKWDHSEQCHDSVNDDIKCLNSMNEVCSNANQDNPIQSDNVRNKAFCFNLFWFLFYLIICLKLNEKKKKINSENIRFLFLIF